MLGTVIEKLSGLLSKSFVIAAFIPLFAFCILNGAFFYFQSPPFHQLVDRYANSATHIAGVLITIAIVSFFFSMQNTRLREIMEGSYAPAPLRNRLTKEQSLRYRRIMRAETELRGERRQYDKAIAEETWHNQLTDGRSAAPKPAICRYGRDDPAFILIHRLDRLRLKGKTIPFSDVDLAVRLLAKSLRDNPLPEGVKAAELLRADQRKLEYCFRGLEHKNSDNCNTYHETIWTARLSKSRQPGCTYSANNPAAEAIAALDIKRRAGYVLDPREIQDATAMFSTVLSLNTIPPDAAAGRRLDKHQNVLYELFDYAQNRALDEACSLFAERQFNFPSGALAPTAMGNIARSIRSYGLSRYSLNLDTFWTRLQKVMQPDPFYAVLQDAKVQLDFMVAVFWLAIVTLIIWIPVLAFSSGNLFVYLGVAAAGGLVVWSSYGLALRNYRTFADLMRTSVDLFRLNLLKELRAPEPSGSAHEALLWRAVEERMEFGAAFNLTYEPKK